MGVGYDFVCITCKKSYGLGYGSCGTWNITYSIEEFEKNSTLKRTALQKNSTLKRTALQKNINIRKCLEEHEGHETTYYNHDFMSVRESDGALIADHPYEPEAESIPIVEGYRDFERIKMEGA